MNVQQGDRAEIIESHGGKMVGAIVRVVEAAGVHSKLGPMWLVRGEAEALETHVGSMFWKRAGGNFDVGATAHCADSWLRKIPDPPKTKAVPRQTELVKD